MKNKKTQFLRKIKSPEKLKILLFSLMKNKKKVVFTNGCFDLLHKGHVTYLEKAKGLGDILVLALNSDSSVKRLKGKNRPINPLADRLEVVAALESVDFVTWFDEDTPLQLIKLLKPNVLVKGGDWKVNQIVGATEVISGGGKVRSLKYVEGRSTTKMIKKAQLQ